jgi:hypothetical protein
MPSIKIITRAEQLAFLARKRRWQLAVYFSTGIMLPSPPIPHFQTSSSTITSKTLFVCQQSHHRS